MSIATGRRRLRIDTRQQRFANPRGREWSRDLRPTAGVEAGSWPLASNCRRRARRPSAAAGAFLAIAVFLLWEEHKAHILGALPYLLLLAAR